MSISRPRQAGWLCKGLIIDCGSVAERGRHVLGHVSNNGSVAGCRPAFCNFRRLGITFGTILQAFSYGPAATN
jgi:hypothetical protein